MTTLRVPSHHARSSAVTSNHTREPSQSSNHNNGSDTVLVAKKLSNINLAEREERQQALDRLDMLKTVRRP